MSPREAHKFNVDSLAVGLERAGIVLPPETLARLWRFHELLREADAELNLTRIRSFDAIVRKHYVDSLIVPRILEGAGLALPSPLADIGSGGGFPGLPLGIAHPDCEITLVEGRAVRCAFLESAVRELELPNVRVLTLKVSPAKPGPSGSLITRAFAGMPETVERTANARRPGDLLLFMKGPNCDPEVAELARDARVSLVADLPYTLPHSADERRLVVWRWESEAPHPSSARSPSPAADRDLVIRSRDNPLLRTARGLWKGRMIRKAGLALVFGRRLIGELVARSPERVEALLLSESDDRSQDLLESRDAPPVRRVADQLLRELDPQGFGSPVLVVRVPEPQAVDLAAELPGLTVLLPLGDPENLGAALRSCAAFGVDRVVLLAEAAHPFHPRAIRASAGACFHLQMLSGPGLDVLGTAVSPGTECFALDAGGEPVDELRFPENMLLVLGEEGGHLPPALPGRRIGIPIRAQVESLNVAVAAGIALERIQSKRAR